MFKLFVYLALLRSSMLVVSTGPYHWAFQ